MRTFRQPIRAHDRVAVPPEQIWAVLRDPDQLAALTPLVSRIEVDGDRWLWRLVGVTALGMTVAPSFTTILEFGDRQIDFRPAPDVDDWASASGRIDVIPVPSDDPEPPFQTDLQIQLTASVDLPLPKLAGRAVQKTMFATMKGGGTRFADNLLAQLGHPDRAGIQITDDPGGLSADRRG